MLPVRPRGAAPSPARSFSLVEVLVTVAILAVLASLLLPGLQHAAQAARATACASHLRQIGTAATVWANDNDGKIVPVFWPGESGDANAVNTWQGYLASYLGYKGAAGLEGYGSTNELAGPAQLPAFVCPERKTKYGYGYNANYLSYFNSTVSGRWVLYSQIPRPSETALLADSYCVTQPARWRAFVRTPSQVSINDTVPEYRHPGRTAHVLWLDGHVTSESSNSPTMLSDTYWNGNGPSH